MFSFLYARSAFKFNNFVRSKTLCLMLVPRTHLRSESAASQATLAGDRFWSDPFEVFQRSSQTSATSGSKGDSLLLASLPASQNAVLTRASLLEYLHWNVLAGTSSDPQRKPTWQAVRTSEAIVVENMHDESDSWDERKIISKIASHLHSPCWPTPVV